MLYSCCWYCLVWEWIWLVFIRTALDFKLGVKRESISPRTLCLLVTGRAGLSLEQPSIYTHCVCSVSLHYSNRADNHLPMMIQCSPPQTRDEKISQALWGRKSFSPLENVPDQPGPLRYRVVLAKIHFSWDGIRRAKMAHVIYISGALRHYLIHLQQTWAHLQTCYLWLIIIICIVFILQRLSKSLTKSYPNLVLFKYLHS